MDTDRPHHVDDPEGIEDLLPKQEPLGGGYPEFYDPDAGRPERKDWKGDEEEPKTG